mgnify:CR=1 FL=1
MLMSCEENKPVIKIDINLVDQKVRAGAIFYHEECARCHGDHGQGNKKKKYPKMKTGLTLDEFNYALDFPEGVMPEFDDLEDSLTRQIHQYVKTLEPNR